METFKAMLGVLVAAVGVSLNAWGQQSAGLEVQQWPEGEVVLTNGDIIYGPLALYRAQDVVSVQNEDGSISSYSPVHVQYFVAQDQPSGRAYLFRTMPRDMGRTYSDFKKPIFFEQLNQGPLTLMRREVPMNPESNNTTSLYGRNSYAAPGSYPVGYAATEQTQEIYYMLQPNGEIVTLQNVRRDLHKLFGKKSGKVKAYVKEHCLDYDRPYMLIAIVNHFNSL